MSKPLTAGEFLIRTATSSDSKILSGLSQTTFYQTYVAIHPENAGLLRAYTEETFSEEKIQRQSQLPAVYYYVVESGDVVLGYMKTVRGDAPDQVLQKPSLELEKLYVKGEFQGRGLGQKLFDFLIPVALASGHRSIWLSVYENNPGAIAFYRKNGFRVVGEKDFVYSWNGTEYRDRDKLMEFVF